MNWFLIALGAPFLWAVVNIVDKYLVSKYSTGENSSGGLVLFSSLIGLFVSLGIIIFVDGVFGISFIDKILLLISGILSAGWIILYLFALEIEDISAVIPWTLTIPIWGYMLGYFFLGETLTSHQLIGSLITIFGVLLISIDFVGEKRRIKVKPALYMIGASVLVAIIGVIFKYVTIEGDFWVSSFWEYLGLGLVGVFILIFVPRYRKDFIKMNRTSGKLIFSLNILNELGSILGNLITNFALLLAPVSMIYLVGSFQPVILLFLVIFVTKFFPKIITENIERRVLIPKFIAIAVIIIGSLFLFN